MPATIDTCPRCARPIPARAPKGLCPTCLASALSDLLGQEEDQPVAPIATPASLSEWVGDYELLEELGRGGMGVVFRARDRRLNRVVALKLILAGRLASDAELKRFRNEAESVAQLHHPQIVPIYEVGESEGRHFFAMQLVEGGALSQRISTIKSPISDHDAAKLLAKVARAVHHAHQRGILHRDLKPANILIKADGEPMVTDFGLARRVDGESSLTLSGAAVGSPSYMAPEQAAGGLSAVTTAADIYGLGAILYELLAGRPPFQAATPLETLRQVIEEEPIPPRLVDRKRQLIADSNAPAHPPPSINHQLRSPSTFTDRDLETICLKCLAKDPSRRYPTAEALAEDLERWLRHEPILARPSGQWERMTKWARRRPAAALLVLVTTCSVIGFAGLLTMAGLRLRAERNRALAQEEATRQSLYAADVYLAQQALHIGNLGLARRALAGHQPAPDRKDLRGFEWHYLWSLCQGDQVATLRGHTAPVLCVAFSSDGRSLVSGGVDRTIRVWDLETRQIQLALDRTSDTVVAVAFSPNGRQIMVGTADALVTTWDLKTQSLVSTCRATGPMTLAPVSNRAAFSWTSYPKSGREEVVTIFDLDSGIALHTERQAGGQAAIAQNGRSVASGGPAGLKLWEAESGRVLKQIPETEPLSAFFISRDDRRLAALANGGLSVKVWDLTTGERTAQFAVPEAKFQSADFSPDGEWLVTGGTDQSIHLWNLIDPTKHASLKGHENEVRALAFSPDGRWLASASKDGTVRLWKAGPPDAPLVPTNAFPVCALSSNGKALATQDRPGRGTNVNVLVWDLVSWQAKPLPHSRGAQPVAFIENDSTLLAMRRPISGDVLWLDFYDLAHGSNRTSLSLTNSNRPRTALDYSRSAGLFALGSYNGEVLVWRAADGRLLSTLLGPSNEVLVIRFSPDGRTLAAFTKGEGLRLWDVATARVQLTPTIAAARADDLAFSADGAVLAAADSDNAITLWNATTGDVLTTFRSHAEPVVRLAFAPDGRTLASTSEDGTVKLWSLPAQRELATIFRGGTMAHLEFTPDGQTLFGTTAEGHLHYWRVPAAR